MNEQNVSIVSHTVFITSDQTKFILESQIIGDIIYKVICISFETVISLTRNTFIFWPLFQFQPVILLFQDFRRKKNLWKFFEQNYLLDSHIRHSKACCHNQCFIMQVLWNLCENFFGCSKHFDFLIGIPNGNFFHLFTLCKGVFNNFQNEEIPLEFITEWYATGDSLFRFLEYKEKSGLSCSYHSRNIVRLIYCHS